MTRSTALQGGVLCVGSLFWDERPPREAWRKAWLSLSEATTVPAPIRYGRFSRSRGDTYTMVFSRLCIRASYAGGVGLAVPFRARARGLDDVLEAARALWAAEAWDPTPGEAAFDSWGGVALVVDPSRRETRALARAWARWVRARGGFPDLSCLSSEGPPVWPHSGLLRMPWPRALNERGRPLDFLLATATDPTLLGSTTRRYATSAEIARAWNNNNAGDVRYFHRNRRHGIATFQDAEIQRRLERDGSKVGGEL